MPAGAQQHMKLFSKATLVSMLSICNNNGIYGAEQYLSVQMSKFRVLESLCQMAEFWHHRTCTHPF